MFLNLSHSRLDVYQFSRRFVLTAYDISKQLPESERFAMVQQMRRAATSVSLNLAEGCSRKSLAERRRFFEISRSSLVEIDTIYDLCEDLSYRTKEEMQISGELMVRVFKMLSAMINKC